MSNEIQAFMTVRPTKRLAESKERTAKTSQNQAARFAKARTRYRPSVVRYLLVAESPPKPASGRYFYFEEVTEKDTLFWETMKVLYPGDMPASGYPRDRKREFLKRFQSDGFYLLDAVDEHLGKTSPAVKRQRLRDSLPQLRNDLRRACEPQTKIILISASVHAVCAPSLKSEGFNVINKEMIDFPGSGCQKKFREKFSRVLGRAEFPARG